MKDERTKRGRKESGTEERKNINEKRGIKEGHKRKEG